MGTVAVFGGSGRLGRLIVRRVAQDAPVRFTFLSQADAAAAFAAELRAQGRDVEAVRVDVRDAAEVAAFLRATAAVDGRLAGIVSANGNRFPVRPLQDVDEGDFRRIVEVDVFGNFHVLQAGTRLLAAQGGGAIVVLLTAAILRTATCDGMSSIPKAAVASMIRQLARDAGRLDVRCNGVAPGAMRTSKVMDVEVLDPYERHLVQEFVADTPSGRLNDPETVAELIAFLLSDRAASISGQIIAADGGYSA